MKIHDISLTLSESLPVWPGDRQPHFEKKMKLEQGDIANVTYMKMGVHTGTHVDAPCHFLKEGNAVEHLSLEMLIGDAVVIEALDVDLITKEVLEKANIPANTLRLLVKTRNSEHWTKESTEFDPNYVALSADGSKYLVEKGIRLVGVDSLSVAPFNDVTPTHEILLGAEIVIVEGLNLAKIKVGHYTLCCLPLKIAGSDGSPARAVLIED